MSSSINFAD